MADIETPTWRCKQKIGQMMTRLEQHGQGLIEMTPSQIQAAKLYLSKTLPDLARTEHTGKDGEKLSVGIIHAIPASPNDNKSSV